MKTKRLLMLMFASAALLFSSCGKENDIQDDFFGEERTLQVFTSMYIDSRFKISLITNDNNEPFFRAEHYKPSIYSDTYFDNEIFDVGTISSFSDISVIPSNWMQEVSVKESHGYVCRTLQSGVLQFYWKLYVKEIVKDASGDILAVKCIVSEEWEL